MTTRIIAMSTKEVDRLLVIQQVESKQLTQVAAAKRLNLTTRHVRRLQTQYRREGPASLVSKRRGAPSNHRLNQSLKDQVIHLITLNYHDFGPTFAHEKLTEVHGLTLSVESVRQLMLKAGLWVGKRRKTGRIHQRRVRRSCLGELVQIDGSPHDWFEGRAPRCCLLVFIDDATSRLMWLHFTEAETTEAYFTATEAYLKHHGRPLSFYSDRHSIFRVNIPEAASGTGETQFSRAMRELDIELICANSPQAKGRVEKANGTLQDRLIKEMRLKGISNIPAANAFLPEFIADYNKRFAVAPASPVDAHRSTLPDDVSLNLIFSQHHPRKLSNNLELSYNNVIYQIQTEQPSYAMRQATLTVCDKKGQVTLRYKGKSLPYKTIDKHNRPTPVVSHQQLNHPKPPVRKTKPKTNHPWRTPLNPPSPPVLPC